MKRIILGCVVLALMAFAVSAADEKSAPSTPPDAKKLAAERAKEIKDNIDHLQFVLRCVGPPDKPFYCLSLSVAPIENEKAPAFMLSAVIDKATAAKIVDRLAESGTLGREIDRRPADGGKEKARVVPHFVILVCAGKTVFECDLGWGKPMLDELLGIRKLLAGDSAKQMDVLLGQLNGYIKEWTGKDYVPPKPDDPKAAEAAVSFTEPVTVVYFDFFDCGASEIIFTDKTGKQLYLYNKPFKADLFLSTQGCDFTPDMTCSVQITEGSKLGERLAAALMEFAKSRADEAKLKRIRQEADWEKLTKDEQILRGTMGFAESLQAAVKPPK